MEIHIGTSGFAYKEWIGSFYPQGIRDKEMLAWYAQELDCVEINNTFYRMPTTASLAAWSTQVPEGFRFAIKAPQRITHQKRLRAVEEDVAQLLAATSTLGPRLGPLLFQLPPRMKPDLSALRDLLIQLPEGVKVAFEFRDLRWHCDELYTLLAERECALCFNDAYMPAPHPTAPWGYVRLRREGYQEEELRRTIEQLQRQPWEELFLFVKHEAPDSPLLARRLRGMWRAEGR